MKCPECDFVQSDQNAKCSKCGLIFERNREPQASISTKQGFTARRDIAAGDGTFFQNTFFFVESKVNPFYFGGRIVVGLILFIWGWIFILTPMAKNYAGGSFFHLVNLPFHEAGHLFFQLFGRWMGSLGGTLGQLLIPFICLLVFLIKYKNPFGASVCLWWLGESLMDIAPYINDAREQELVLLGGITGREADYGTHDWEFILNEIGWLEYDHTLAYLSHYFGIVLMLLSFGWAAHLLLRQYRNLDMM